MGKENIYPTQEERQIMKNYTNNASVIVGNILSWVISIAGLIVGIIGLCSKESVNDKIMYLIIVLDTLILVLCGMYLMINFYRNKNEINEYNILSRENDKTITRLQTEKDTLISTSENINSNLGYIIGLLNKSICRLIAMSSECLEQLESIQSSENKMRSHNYTEEEIDEELSRLVVEKNKIFSKRFIDEYNIFLVDIMNHVKEIIEEYLKGIGLDLRVSVTLKQLIKPHPIEGLHDTEKNVYTAFRDNKTWREKVRSIREGRLYTIKKNIDFSFCLDHNYYIFNNKTTDDKDYENENKMFLEHYNSGVTTLLSFESNGIQNVYGFLACDVLNPNSENVVMDNYIGNIMMGAADIISLYFSNLDEWWNNVNCSHDFNSFWEMIYSYHNDIEILDNNSVKC